VVVNFQAVLLQQTANCHLWPSVCLQAKAALLDHIAQHGMLSVPHEHLRAALDLPPSASLNSPKRAAELK
jgi:hypothetical protein